MLNKVGNHFKKSWREYAGALTVCVLIFIVLLFGYQLWKLDLNTPMAYDGADDVFILVNAKMLEQQNWVLSTDRLGAPYTTDLYDFTANMMHNTDVIILKLFVFLTHSSAAAVNLTFLSTFFITGLISYFVMRELKIRPWIASLTSAAFGLSPFMVMRGIQHIVLAECYFIPLSLLLCFWLYERDDVFQLNKQFFKQPRNYFALLFILLIANNGIAYYPFFTCFLLLLTAISKLLKTGKGRYLVRGFLLVVGICAFVGLSILPGIIYSYQHGANSAAINRGGFVETEVYGLKIIQMLLPVNDHGITFLSKIIQKYTSNTLELNENITSYIGIIGIIGLIILILTVFLRKNSALKERLGLLSEMNIMLLLLGTTSGFGTVFAFFISDELRAYNRISIVIEYVCILAFAMCLNKIYIRYSTGNKNWKRYCILFLGVVFIIGSIYFDFPRNYTPDYESIKQNYENDDRFVGEIESMVKPKAMIFELPYHEYPEGGAVNGMADYELFVGFLHSNTLRWSYGAIKGRVGSDWNHDVAAMNCSDMVDHLLDAGFSGIYIDRRAYEEKDWETLETNLAERLNQKPIVSDNGNQSFFLLGKGM